MTLAHLSFQFLAGLPLGAYYWPVTVPCSFHLKEEDLLGGEDGGGVAMQISAFSGLYPATGRAWAVITVGDVQKKGAQRRDEVLVSPLVHIPNVCSPDSVIM